VRFIQVELLLFENSGSDDLEDFVDSGNGIIDGAEEYTDLDGDEQADNDELFLFNPIPNKMLVTWADPQNPQVINIIEPGDSLVTRWGITYYNIIEISEKVCFIIKVKFFGC